MPIILISVDEQNTLSDFQNMLNQVDVIMESTDERSRAITNIIAEHSIIINRLPTDRLDKQSDNETLEDVRIRFQAVLNMVRSLNILNAIIISHSSVINTWCPNTIQDNWEILEM